MEEHSNPTCAQATSWDEVCDLCLNDYAEWLKESDHE